MQKENERWGAGDAVDMEEEHARGQRGSVGGARTGQRAGGEQGGITGSDRFEFRAVTSPDEVLIDRGVADRGFARAGRGHGVRSGSGCARDVTGARYGSLAELPRQSSESKTARSQSVGRSPRLSREHLAQAGRAGVCR